MVMTIAEPTHTVARCRIGVNFDSSEPVLSGQLSAFEADLTDLLLPVALPRSGKPIHLDRSPQAPFYPGRLPAPSQWDEPRPRVQSASTVAAPPTCIAIDACFEVYKAQIEYYVRQRAQQRCGR